MSVAVGRLRLTGRTALAGDVVAGLRTELALVVGDAGRAFGVALANVGDGVFAVLEGLLAFLTGDLAGALFGCEAEALWPGTVVDRVIFGRLSLSTVSSHPQIAARRRFPATTGRSGPMQTASGFQAPDWERPSRTPRRPDEFPTHVPLRWNRRRSTGVSRRANMFGSRL